jgi:hypothetical protein
MTGWRVAACHRQPEQGCERCNASVRIFRYVVSSGRRTDHLPGCAVTLLSDHDEPEKVIGYFTDAGA